MFLLATKENTGIIAKTTILVQTTIVKLRYNWHNWR